MAQLGVIASLRWIADYREFLADIFFLNWDLVPSLNNCTEWMVFSIICAVSHIQLINCFPLIVAGRTEGVRAPFAGKVDTFDDDETVPVQELADHIVIHRERKVASSTRRRTSIRVREITVFPPADAHS